MRYATKTDAIDQAIKPALDEGDYDVDKIFEACFKYLTDVDEQGRYLLNTAGFEQVVSDETFWDVVAECAL